MTFCDHTGPKSSQTCHTSTRARRQWGLNWAIIPDRTPLWRLFPLPGTTTRRLSPPAAPFRPALSPVGAEGFRWPAASNHGQLDLWAGRAGNKTNLDWWRLTDSTQRPQRAPCCVKARAGSFSSRPQRQMGGGPARCRKQPSTIPRLRRQTTLLCLRHRETP